MTPEKRLKELQKYIEEHPPITHAPLYYKSKNNQFPVYEIPLEFVVFNQFNGRIGSYIKTYEKENETLNASNPDDERKIIDFLWSSDVARNEKTLKDLEAKGQQQFGILTKDGVVIDGNRRCMLLKKLASKKKEGGYFQAIVLDETLDSNSKEIRRLETTYQMGVDEKADYKPIEKYLKCKDLINEGFTEAEIATFMNVDESTIKKYLGILNLLEEYLESIESEGLYTRLEQEKVEGPFVDLHNYLSRYNGEDGRIQGMNWNPDPPDIDDLKTIYFDYIRAGFRAAQNIRFIGNTAKNKGAFTNKQIWENFSKEHFDFVDSIKEKEKSVEDMQEERPGESLIDIVKARDEKFVDNVKNDFKNKLNRTVHHIDSVADSGKPLELTKRALNALNSIDEDTPEFKSKEVQIIMDEIRKFSESRSRFLKKTLGPVNNYGHD